MELQLKKSYLVTVFIISAVWFYTSFDVFLSVIVGHHADPDEVAKILKKIPDDFGEQCMGAEHCPFDENLYLINKQGCYIPNYKLFYVEAKNGHDSCGTRAIFIKKINDTKIRFKIDWSKIKSKYRHNATCCYQYIKRHSGSMMEDDFIEYTKCLPFHDGTIATLKSDFINVACINKRIKKTVYNDTYMLIKNVVKKNMTPKNKNTWNVLMLGLDTVSRLRVYHAMPHTAKYFNTHEWLDYRGYHKVASNTFPNLIASLTGKALKTIQRACIHRMSDCNHMFMWSKFSKLGYVTAYAEDFIDLPDTFSKYDGYKTPPTDHYGRPFFLTGEKEKGNLLCTKTMPSAYHILNYALSFAKTYHTKKHFGFFWLNSYSHNFNQIPTLIDKNIVSFFETLNNTGSFDNTFVFFFSDHGLRFGATRDSVASYYDERLPMLFIWVPRNFRIKHPDYYYNLKSNQYSLTTPYDIYYTLWKILQMSAKFIKIPEAEACPNCTSLFNEIPDSRTCAEVNVTDKWCACHDLVDMSSNNTKAKKLINIAVNDFQQKTLHAKTKKCTICSPLKLDKVLRLHKYNSEDQIYYVLAFSLKPGEIKFEMTLKENNATGEIDIIRPTYTISKYNSKGFCVINPNDREFCVCKKVC